MSHQETTKEAVDAAILALVDNGAIIKAALTVSAAAYVAGNCVGGLVDLSAVMRDALGSALLQSVLVTEVGTQKAALDILLFDAQPAGTFTDHAAFPALALADAKKIIRRISVAASDYVTVGGVSTADIVLSKLLQAESASDLWMAINTSGTPTFAATTALSVSLGLHRD